MTARKMLGRGMFRIDFLGPSAIANAGIESGTSTTIVVAFEVVMPPVVVVLVVASAKAKAGGGDGGASMIGAVTPP